MKILFPYLLVTFERTRFESHPCTAYRYKMRSLLFIDDFLLFNKNLHFKSVTYFKPTKGNMEKIPIYSRQITTKRILILIISTFYLNLSLYYLQEVKKKHKFLIQLKHISFQILLTMRWVQQASCQNLFVYQKRWNLFLAGVFGMELTAGGILRNLHSAMGESRLILNLFTPAQHPSRN
jgi:hypothetical protein